MNVLRTVAGFEAAKGMAALAGAALLAAHGLAPQLACGLLAYAALRLVEAYGLWRARAWAEWLGVLSATLYLPLEVRHAVHAPGAAVALLILLNLAVIAYLCARLRERGIQGDSHEATLAPSRGDLGGVRIADGGARTARLPRRKAVALTILGRAPRLTAAPGRSGGRCPASGRAEAPGPAAQTLDLDRVLGDRRDQQVVAAGVAVIKPTGRHQAHPPVAVGALIVLSPAATGCQ